MTPREYAQYSKQLGALLDEAGTKGLEKEAAKIYTQNIDRVMIGFNDDPLPSEIKKMFPGKGCDEVVFEVSRIDFKNICEELERLLRTH